MYEVEFLYLYRMSRSKKYLKSSRKDVEKYVVVQPQGCISTGYINTKESEDLSR